MMRIAAWLFLIGIIAGIGGLAATTDSASAAELNIDCTSGDVVDGVGTVSCTLTVADLPDPLTDFTLTLEATYNDVDGDGAPSPGDQFKCITVSGDTIPTTSFCRPDPEAPTPPEVPTPPAP